MTNEVKKEKVKKILQAIQDSAINIIDSGEVDKHPMDLVMELTMTAYELDLLTDFVNRAAKETPKDAAPNNVVKLIPKDVH